MSAPIIITLPGQPRGKERPRAGSGGFYTPSPTRAYEADLKLMARVAMRGRDRLEGPLKVLVIGTMQVPRSWPVNLRAGALDNLSWPTVRPDWDNIGKTTDALNGVVWGDDAQVIDGRVIKAYGAEPGVRVIVRLLDGDALIDTLSTLRREMGVSA